MFYKSLLMWFEFEAMFSNQDVRQTEIFSIFFDSQQVCDDLRPKTSSSTKTQLKFLSISFSIFNLFVPFKI